MSVSLLYIPAKTENEKLANGFISKASMAIAVKRAAFDNNLNVCQKDIDNFHIYKSALKTMIATEHGQWVEVEKLICKKLQSAVKYFNTIPNAYDFYEDMTNKVKKINANGLRPEKTLKTEDEANYFLLVECVRDLRDLVKDINLELDKERYDKKFRASNAFDRMSNETCIKELRATTNYYEPKIEEVETR